MNIRILTFSYSEKNIGQVLQQFSLQKFIQYYFNEKPLIYKFKNFGRYRKYNSNIKYNFTENLNYKLINSFEDLENDKFDYIIFGSDQLLNCRYNIEIRDIINFLTNKFSYKVIPYALSRDDYLNNNIHDLKMKTLSFREFISKEELKYLNISAYNENININIDPVFLFDKNFYSKYENRFILNVESKDMSNNIYYCNEIERFLWEYNNYDKYDDWTSYHAFCFSLIFRKKFHFNKISKINSLRFKSLISLLNIKFDNNYFVCNFDEIDEKIKKERENTLNYFKENLI